MKRHEKPSIFALFIFTFAALSPAEGLSSIQDETTLVSFVGEVSVKSSPNIDWKPAITGEALAGGSLIKTAAVSSANVLFPDGTQIKLAENSELKIKTTNPSKPKKLSSSDLLLARGKLWGRAKSLPDKLSISTPTATASIRGTEWEVDASIADTATVTVLSGQVELSNSIGSVLLEKNMRGTATSEQKPKARRINSARDRVQWISNYEPSPSLYLGFEHSDSLHLTTVDRPCELAQSTTSFRQNSGVKDSLLYLKSCAVQAMREARIKNVFELLNDHHELSVSWLGHQIKADLEALSGNYNGSLRILSLAEKSLGVLPGLNAQRAAINLHFGNLERVESFIQSPDFANAPNPLKYLVAGDYFFLEGDFLLAEESYRLATDNKSTKTKALTRLAKLHRAYGNNIESELLLGSALELDPENYFARSQNAELQLANSEYGAAIETFEQLLIEKPDDLMALNALAEAYLAQSRSDEALKKIKTAGLIEPSSALPNITAGLIHHQKGDFARSQDELLDASEKDPRDPMPMFLLSAISADDYRIEDAMNFSREALLRIPYLKSLDKVSTDQNGSSNIGNAYNKFGLEDFAKLYALDSYQPNWAGSQFFLAEREPESFSRSSLSLRGFLNEPTTFGASKRRVSLIDSANVSTEIIYDRSGEAGFQSNDARVAVSGLTFTPIPVSFFIQKTKGKTKDEGYGEEFRDTFSSVSSAYSELVTGAIIDDAMMGAAWDRQVSDADKDINTFGLGAKPTSRLNLFSLYVRSKEKSPTSRIYADSAKINGADSYLRSDISNSELLVSEALRIFPVIDERTNGRYLNKLFVAGFKYQLTDSMSLLGKHSRTKNVTDIDYNTTTICPLSTVTNQSVGIELQNELLPIVREILFLNNFYSPGNPSSIPKTFWNLYDQALSRGFRSECPLTAFTDQNYQTQLNGYDTTSNTLEDYSIFLEGSGSKFKFSMGYEVSKSRDLSFWGTTGTDINHYRDPVEALMSQYQNLPGIDFFCKVSPVQSPLCQSINEGSNPLFIKILDSPVFYEEIDYFGRDFFETEYASVHVKYDLNDKALIDIAVQGIKSKADFFKKYRNSAVDYLYGGFRTYFPGADLSDVDGDTVSINAPQSTLTIPNGPNWKLHGSVSVLLKPKAGVYVNLGHTDSVKPNLNVTLAPVYLGFAPTLPYSVDVNNRVSTNLLSATLIQNKDSLYRLSLSQSKIQSEQISENSGWGGSYVLPSTKGYTEWLTSNVFDQMRSNNLRGLHTTVGPYENNLCTNCRRNTKAELGANFVISPRLSANLTYIHHWNSQVVPLGSSTFLSGALECLASVISEKDCGKRENIIHDVQAFPRHYLKTGVTWIPTSNFELSLVVEHATVIEKIAYGVASLRADENGAIQTILSDDWTDAHAMLRWQSKNRRFKIEAMFNGMFSEKYPANFLIRSSLNL